MAGRIPYQQSNENGIKGEMVRLEKGDKKAYHKVVYWPWLYVTSVCE